MTSLNYFVRLLAFAFLLTLVIPKANAEVIDIEHSQLQQLLAQKIPVVDIRLPSEWEDTGVIQGSKLATFFDERGRYNAAQWLDSIKSVTPKTEPIIVICRSGNRTKMVSQFLSQQAGYAKVYNVKYGIQAWVKNGGAVVPIAKK